MKKLGIMIGCSLILLTSGCTNTKTTEVIQQVELQSEEEMIEASGKVEAREIREFYVDLTGGIEEVHVKEGDLVEVGAPLLTLDLIDYKAQMSKIENEIAIYELQLSQLDQTMDPQVASINYLKETINIKKKQLSEGSDPDLITLQKSLKLAEELENTAIKDYETAKELLEGDVISLKEVEDFEKQIKVKENDKEAIKQNIEKLKQAKQLEINQLQSQIKGLNVGISNTDQEIKTNREMLELQVQTAKINLGQMQRRLEVPYLQDNQIINIEAPLIITDINASKGGKVENTIGPLLKAINKESLVVCIEIPEEYIDEVKLGDKVKVIPYGNEEKAIYGAISKISELVTESYGENVIKAEIEIDKEVDWLKLGVSVDVEI